MDSELNEQLKSRLAEEELQDERNGWLWRAKTAEATVERVKAALDDADWGGPDRADVISEIRAALKGNDG